MKRYWFAAILGCAWVGLIGCSAEDTTADDDDQAQVATPTPAVDGDGDGFPASSDCDDSDASVNPSVAEVCDGVDNNCNGTVDEGFPIVDYYRDADQDGYGDAGSSGSGCVVPDGYVDVGGDCDDSDPAVHPGTTEIPCNGVDENCSADDDDSPDRDADGYDICDEGVAGSDGLPADCDDSDYSVNPGAAESCDGKDNDCDGAIDEDLVVNTYYYDGDGDGYGTTEDTIEACGPTPGYVAEGTDCADDDPTRHPGALETRGDGVDSDCDGYSDDVITLSATDGPGYSGDGGPISEAQFDAPHGLAVDRDGNVYIADTNNNAIRRVDLDGTVTTVLGGEEPIEGEDTVLAAPAGLATDGVNLYIADSGHHRVLKWSPSTGILETAAGTGDPGYDGEGLAAASSSLNTPMDVAVSNSVLYIADTGNHIIREVSLRSKSPVLLTAAGTPETEGYAGDAGPALNAYLSAPQGVAVDSSGTTLYIADTGNHIIRRVDRQGYIYLVAGTPEVGGFDESSQSALSTLFSSPTCLIVALTTDIYVCDTGNNRIRQITPTDWVITLAGNGNDSDGILEGNATSVDIAAPTGIVFDAYADLWISDTGHSWIRKLAF